MERLACVQLRVNLAPGAARHLRSGRWTFISASRQGGSLFRRPPGFKPTTPRGAVAVATSLPTPGQAGPLKYIYGNENPVR